MKEQAKPYQQAQDVELRYNLDDVVHTYDSQYRVLTITLPVRTGPIFTQDYIDSMEAVMGERKAGRVLDEAAEELIGEIGTHILNKARR